MTPTSVYELIMRDEGFRGHMYRDEYGNETIGYGVNLRTTEIPPPVAQMWMQSIVADLRGGLPQWTADLDPVRRAVLIDMAYNLGIMGVMEFKNFLAFVKAGDWANASAALLDSKAARIDAPERYARLAKMVETGEWQ